MNTFNNIFQVNKIFGNNDDLLLMGQLESSYITNFPNAKNVNDKNFEDVYVVYTLFINNKKFVLVSLFASVFSIMMFNTYVGSIAFILTIIVLCKEKNLKVLNS